MGGFFFAEGLQISRIEASELLSFRLTYFLLLLQLDVIRWAGLSGLIMGKSV